MYLFGLCLTPEVTAALQNPTPCDGKKSSCNISGVCGSRCTECAQLLCDCCCPCESSVNSKEGGLT